MTVRVEQGERALARLRWPLRLALAGLVWERAARALWPSLSLALASFAAQRFAITPSLVSGLALAAGAAALWGLWRVRWPRRAEALYLLDSRLQGRPIAALQDALSMGATDPAAQALWQAHRARMALRVAQARAPLPKADLAPRDPFALRLTALTAFAMALLFGHAAPPVAPAEAAMGPSWEGWATPPRYTGKPAIYLRSLENNALTLPEGTEFSFRFYGQESELTQDLAAEVSQKEGVVQFVARQSGEISLPDGRAFEVTLQPDASPEVRLPRMATRRADGRLAQPFEASDDYGVVKGRATITLDLAAVPRDFGLATPPEPRAALEFDLPMPLSGGRNKLAETLVEEAAKHPWANLPVRMVLEVEDGLGQRGQTEPQSMPLAGKRFFDPLAAALIEQRRDLLWNAANGARVAQLLRAVNYRLALVSGDAQVAMLLPAVIERLEAGVAAGKLEPALRDDLAEALWEMAEQVEGAGLDDALAAMQQAQQRLSEAIRNGASADEIAKLMQDLKQATDEYIDQLAEQSEEQGPQFGAQQESQAITGDQIQEMMDEIAKLMEQGRMAEAQALLDQLAQLMANLQMQQGQGGEGQQGEGQQGQQGAMGGLAETLREQQRLSDEAFGQAQRGEGGGDLAERQEALRRELGRQRELMPRPGNEAGEAARQRLQSAEEAMRRAEEALRQGETGAAMGAQADAIEALREGMRDLGQALGAQGEASPEGRDAPRDPLGRAQGDGGILGGEERLLGELTPDARARSLLDELRKRSGEQTRPEAERDYLRRLLDLF